MKRGEWHEGGFLVLACSGLVGRDAGGVNPTLSAVGLMSLEDFPHGAAGCLYTWFDRVVVYFAEEKRRKRMNRWFMCFGEELLLRFEYSDGVLR